MAQVDSKAHPYMPNSAGDTREEMLSAIGLQDVEELFEQIPEPVSYTHLTLPTSDLV